MRSDDLPNNPNIPVAELMALHPAAFGWCRTLVGQRDDQAEDLLQHAYALVVSGEARFDGRSSLQTWLFGVLKNVARQQARRDKRWNPVVVDLETLVAEKADPPDRAQGISASINELPQRQREVLHLLVYRECTLEECARIIGISVGSVRTHYHRAKSTLQKRLKLGDEL